jgi:DNA-binding transcriptional MerR regulator
MYTAPYMPKLQSYAQLVPFSLEELVTAVNSVLRDRPRLAVQARTVRYYIGKGVLPPPGGSPKFARYDMPHLLGIVAIRCLQDLGMSLEDAARALKSIQRDPDSIDRVQEMVERMPSSPAPESLMVSERHMVSTRAAKPMFGEPVVRYRLTEHLVLEAPSSLPYEDALQEASSAIWRLQNSS